MTASTETRALDVMHAQLIEQLEDNLALGNAERSPHVDEYTDNRGVTIFRFFATATAPEAVVANFDGYDEGGANMNYSISWRTDPPTITACEIREDGNQPEIITDEPARAAVLRKLAKLLLS